MVTVFLVIVNVFAQESASFLTNLSERELAVTVANGRTNPWVYRDDSFIGEDRFVWVRFSRSFTDEHTQLTDELIEQEGQGFLEELDRADEVYGLLGEVCSPRSFRYHMSILRDQMLDQAIQACASKWISNHVPGQVAVRNSSGLGEPKVQCSSLESGVVTCLALYECVNVSVVNVAAEVIEDVVAIEDRPMPIVETNETNVEAVVSQTTNLAITEVETTVVSTFEVSAESEHIELLIEEQRIEKEELLSGETDMTPAEIEGVIQRNLEVLSYRFSAYPEELSYRDAEYVCSENGMVLVSLAAASSTAFYFYISNILTLNQFGDLLPFSNMGSWVSDTRGGVWYPAGGGYLPYPGFSNHSTVCMIGGEDWANIKAQLVQIPFNEFIEMRRARDLELSETHLERNDLRWMEITRSRQRR